MNAPLRLCTVLAVLAAFVGCDSDGAAGPGDAAWPSGTLTIVVGEGIDFAGGVVVEVASFTNADIRAVANAPVELRTGGPSITKERPANWFQTAGGVFETFDSLADVPEELPDASDNTPLLNAKTGNGFVLLSAHGGYTRGWISSATDTSVTIEFAPVVE